MARKHDYLVHGVLQWQQGADFNTETLAFINFYLCVAEALSDLPVDPQSRL